jgi:hypothetical protein
MNANLIAALEMAAAGMPVFPMHVFKDDRGKWTKVPAIKSWRTKATTDVEIIERWHREFPQAVFAIELEKAGLVVIDCDTHREDVDGCEAFEKLVAANEDLPSVPITLTSGGGYHIFFRQPEAPIGCPVRTSLPPGVEVKGAGGNVVVPGSIRPDGEEWQPMDTFPTLAHAYRNGLTTIPLWLEKLARKVEPQEPQPEPQPQPERKSRSTVKREGPMQGRRSTGSAGSLPPWPPTADATMRSMLPRLISVVWSPADGLRPAKSRLPCLTQRRAVVSSRMMAPRLWK